MKTLYALGALGPVVFALAVIAGGAAMPGYSHLSDEVSALGASGAPHMAAVNIGWIVAGLLIAALGMAVMLDAASPGRRAGLALLLAGMGSAAIAAWFPTDPPGVQMSGVMLGHVVLVAVSGLAYAAAIVLTGLAPVRPGLRRLSWVALAVMLAGGIGAMAAGWAGWPLLGLFERVTQSGYQFWLLAIAAAGLAGGWRVAGGP